jgi:hypothetical protein
LALITTHATPSAGFILVVEPSFKSVITLPGFGVEVLRDGTLVFNGNMVHFADIHQYTIHAFNPRTRKTTEVFPGAKVSPYGALIMKRIGTLLARINKENRDALMARHIDAGFDRYISNWRVHPSGGTLVAAVQYYRDRLTDHDLELYDDAGQPVPIDRAAYEIDTIVVCSRKGPDAWTCREEELAAVARRHKVSLPTDRAAFFAATQKLVDIVAGAGPR